ncbi:hypothetical protein GOP47_0018900 [Adiantum capillus-veneris]|uniref:Uncharacterized protein n=1 Tax=Adiantum capillus-veneris TaxID=13818 RepID=A0A9D4UE41_ADICA|nr:hypothetical protein GOP47_0018900 [Adiantum capillus-veneris]
MASSDPINVKSLDIPQTADHVSFRDWMRVEVLWNTIEREARFLYNNMRNITSKLGPGEILDSFLEEAKLTHRTEAFQYELGKFKSSGRGSPDLKKALTDAGQRCLCRWLTRPPSSDKVGQVSYSRTGTPKDIGKKPSSSELKKRKHDAVGPNEKELKEFSQSLEQLLDHHEGDQQMVASDDLVFDEQNVSICFLDTSMEENEIVGSMLACIEGQVKKDNRVYV